MLKASSRRETKPSSTRRAAKQSTGCMSGLFQLLSRHHRSRSRKRLASAVKKEETANSSLKPTPSTDKRPPPPENSGVKKELKQVMPQEKVTLAGELRRHSCDASRSPTLPPEIRRSCAAGSPCSPRQPPALVARLMGLVEGAPVPGSPESAAEKRRKLLDALEKCDEDLKALKRIIEAVRLAETQSASVAAIEFKRSKVSDVVSTQAYEKGFNKGDETSPVSLKKCSEFSCEQQPSPVSVLDAISSPRYRSNNSEKARRRGETLIAVGSRNSVPLPQGAFLIGNHYKRTRDDEKSSPYRKMPTKGLSQVSKYNEGKLLEQFGMARRRTECSRRQWRPGTRSKAMVESVGEVWEDGMCEERRELASLGMVLEINILGDLVEEVVVELLGSHRKFSFPMWTCRKRLCF